MPLTRSCEDLVELNRRNPSDSSNTNRSNTTFFIDVEENSNPSGSRPVTRSMAKSNRVVSNTIGNSESLQGLVPANVENRLESNLLDENRIHQMISESLTSFRSELTSEIGVMFNNINFSSNNRIQQQNLLENQLESNATRDNTISGNQNQLRYRDSVNINENSDKILNIIRNWRVKFSGRFDDIDVDEFIYRINILTTNTLNGNFELLCCHAYSIFEGKALDWFWKYHQRNDKVDWTSLTNSLRRQYKSVYSDFDIRDDIRRRFQKQNESFDEFLDSIMAIANKLRTPMSERELCETVLRNLKAEIRHELLHVDISQISQLRYEVHKHEKFVSEIRNNNSYKVISNVRRQISEIDFKPKDFDETPITENNDICAIHRNLICWNCDNSGHSYKDCVKERKIFCYGCGAKDAYKPNCPKCKHQGNLKWDVLQQKKGHPNIFRKN